MDAPPQPKDAKEEHLDKMIAVGKRFHAKTAREAAEMMRGRTLTDAEWETFGAPWEARWAEWK